MDKQTETKLIYTGVWVVASIALLGVVWLCSRGNPVHFGLGASALFLAKMVQEGWKAGERKAATPPNRP